MYAVGDYTPGQQYYAATSNFTSSSSNGNTNNTSSYIVPVDEAILGGVTSSRGSPQTITTVSSCWLFRSRFMILMLRIIANEILLFAKQDVAFIQGQGTSNSSSSSSNASTIASSQHQQQHTEAHKQNNNNSSMEDSTPNLTHATRVSPATVSCLPSLIQFHHTMIFMMM